MIYPLDLAIFRQLNSWAGTMPTFDILIIFFASYLQYALVALFLALLFFWARSKSEKIRIFWVTIISIVIARLGLTELIRLFYHRPRPFAVYQVHQLLVDHEWAFPSGHAAFFFAMAGAIYCYEKKWGIAFFAASILMGISRVAAGVHYPSDILGGMVVGMTVAYVVFYFAERRSVRILKT